MSTKHPLSPLIREEDWWAVWFSFIIILGALVGFIDRVPRLGGWSDDPMAIFSTKRVAESSFRAADIKDTPKLIQALQMDSESPFAQHIRLTFSPDLLAEIDKFTPLMIPSSRLKKAIDSKLTNSGLALRC